MIQLPPNATGSVLASNTFAGKEYQQVILADKDNPSLQVSIDSEGRLSVSDKTSNNTYTSCSGDRDPGTSATTCIANLINPNVKKISLLKVRVDFTEAVAIAAYILRLIKTSTIYVGGTSDLENWVKYDSDSPNATAEARFFSAAPASGISLGDLGVGYIFGQITGTIVAPAQTLEFDFSGLKNKPTLETALESFEIRISMPDGSALATPANIGVWHITWIWTEEDA